MDSAAARQDVSGEMAGDVAPARPVRLADVRVPRSGDGTNGGTGGGTGGRSGGQFVGRSSGRSNGRPGPASQLSARGDVMGGRGTVRQRIAARVIAFVAGLLCRLPERLVWRLADPAGAVAYRIAGKRRDRARRNLRRVVTWMAEHGVGSAGYRLAATDERALEALVRAAFRQHARYYLELARLAAVDDRFIRERLLVETPETVAEAFGPRGPLILVGMHFGAIELPGVLAASLAGTATAPMETLDNPALQRYVARTRARIGVHIVDLRSAAFELAAALERGEPVGLIADRDLTGGGVMAELFGAPAPIPPGPALLAVQSRAPVYVAAVRRAGPGRYRGNLRPLPVPSEGSMRQRINETIRREARLFEQAIVDAPEQWWAVFFPIWPDLERSAPAAPGRLDGGARPGGDDAATGPDR